MPPRCAQRATFARCVCVHGCVATLAVLRPPRLAFAFLSLTLSRGPITSPPRDAALTHDLHTAPPRSTHTDCMRPFRRKDAAPKGSHAAGVPLRSKYPARSVPAVGAFT